ncbi:SH3 domain-containing protein [Streptomyces sp. NPDC058092]|uniref:SH3 domain-containing protein n=1 Tax=Streptomyces sp. NPDC058092 TaxID=3346336 RepID=UPI0036EBED03
MKRRTAAVLPVIATVAACIPMTLATRATASAACGKGVSDKDGSPWNATADGADERSGSSTDCAINGIACSPHKLDHHCCTVAGNCAWTQLRNNSTGVYGWVRDDLLSDYGNGVPCDFWHRK